MYRWKDLEEYDFRVVTLFEEVQLEWLYKWKDSRKLGILLNEYPDVSWFIKNKAPNIKDEITRLELEFKNHKPEKDIREIERDFINSLEDWIIYVTDPDAYDVLSFNKWDDTELLSILDFTNKVVIDVGSGTGSQLFRVAPLAKTVFSVEPVGNLRKYLKNKAKSYNLNNIHIVDGLITDIPFPNDFCDVVISGHVYGDYPEEEFTELMRVIKPGGMMIFMPGNNDIDNDIHNYLVNKGCKWAKFLEPGPDNGWGWKRKYWIKK